MPDQTNEPIKCIYCKQPLPLTDEVIEDLKQQQFPVYKAFPSQTVKRRSFELSYKCSICGTTNVIFIEEGAQ